MDRNYHVLDTRTGNVVRAFLTRAQAYRIADRMDRDYGAVRYLPRPMPNGTGAAIVAMGPV